MKLILMIILPKTKTRNNKTPEYQLQVHSHPFQAIHIDIPIRYKHQRLDLFLAGVYNRSYQYEVVTAVDDTYVIPWASTDRSIARLLFWHHFCHLVHFWSIFSGLCDGRNDCFGCLFSPICLRYLLSIWHVFPVIAFRRNGVTSKYAWRSVKEWKHVFWVYS